MPDEIRTSTNLISQLNVLIVELEASGDYEEVFDLVMVLQDDRRDEQDKEMISIGDCIAEEKIHGKEIDLEMLEVYSEVLLHRLSFDRINWFSDYMDEYNHDPLVNYDNDNENDDLGYQSEEYFDEVQEDDENNHSNGKYFLGDMVREHIGLKILFWKKVDSEARDKLWDEITRYFDVDMTVRKLVKPAAAKMARPKSVYQHTMGRGGYTLGKEKMKKTKDKIKEGTLKVDHGIDALTVVLGKEKGCYARGVGSGVTYKRYFDLPRSRQSFDERILLLQSQLDNERHK
ncbi:hypothetical protein Tco_0873329 [Tanacetum coccineum]